MKVNKDTLFFDGKCGLCAKEIKLLSKLKKDSLELVDIHDLSDEECSDMGVRKDDLLTILHLYTKESVWQKGLKATQAAWRHTAFGWIFAPLTWPLIRPVANRIYTRWAQRRACRLGYTGNCQI